MNKRLICEPLLSLKKSGQTEVKEETLSIPILEEEFPQCQKTTVRSCNKISLRVPICPQNICYLSHSFRKSLLMLCM